MMVRTRTVQRLELNVTHDTYDIDMEINGNAMDLDVFYVIYRNAR